MSGSTIERNSQVPLSGIRHDTIRNGWITAALFALIVGFLGGSSRPDAVQIVALRPLAALFLIPTLYFATRARMADVRVPALLLGLLTVLMIMQLIPLPPAIWQALPGRDVVADMTVALGEEAVWRPISMVPARTLNALASLIVPICGLLVLALMGISRTALLLIVVALGTIDALLALLQISGAGGDALYFYEITNLGSGVGLFANQNHSAVFGAVTLLTIGHLLSDPRSTRWMVWQRAGLFVVFMIVLLSALTGGSRAGLLATMLAVLMTALMLWLAPKRRDRGREALPRLFGFAISARLILALATFMIGLVVASFIALERIPALSSLTASSSFEDLRWQLLPVLQEMIETFWLLGSGFGSFEEVYHIFEPVELMVPAYVNQAHNDWAQLVIEGGVPAVCLVFAAAAWFARRLLAIGGLNRQRLAASLFWITMAATILFASLVDYPLRTPLFQFVAITLVVALCRENLAEPQQSRESR